MCPTPEDSRYDCIHTNELCLFYHGDTPVPKSFRDIKQLLCADLDNCVNDTCFKSHSVTEICWFFPRFRTKNCHHGDSCSQMKYCSLFHNEYHERRDILMNNVVGKTEAIKFVSRTLVELARFQGGSKQLLNRELEKDTSTSCDPSDESKKFSSTSLVDTNYTADDTALVLYKDGNDYIRQYEMALNNRTDDEIIKYCRVLTHMGRVPKAKICIKIEHDTAANAETCAESHTRMEALGYNPLAMILKCPIGDEVSDHRQSLCVFDHDGDIPKEFIKDKMLLCDAFDACDNANCVKSHSFAGLIHNFVCLTVRMGASAPAKKTALGFIPNILFEEMRE
ncbi:hypothetical protein PHMEG_00029154 [Phytophthora megakarya]|uniref:Uncharacterized protein n=1 Tax=Phytophthora megakarya TaxID=4795 RepID=A0A225V4C8_9STRA|nr:hypothetical protein PHMEG_00029154 [Phytophthora megakarya]